MAQDLGSPASVVPRLDTQIGVAGLQSLTNLLAFLPLWRR
jgi:hypothetical protein